MSFALDANILLYASDAASPFHDRARRFLKGCAEGEEILYLAWPSIMAYLRIVTHHAIFNQPLSALEAMQNVENLLALPQVRTIGEGDGFWRTYRQTAGEILPRGNMVPDTHLAAILRQHGINRICTHDRDFGRFPFLEVVDPLAS